MAVLTEEEAENVIRQLCEGGAYYDPDSEYFDGESRKYYFYRADETFLLERFDVVVGSYNTIEEISREWLKEYLLTQHQFSLTEQGFKLGGR